MKRTTQSLFGFLKARLSYMDETLNMQHLDELPANQPYSNGNGNGAHPTVAPVQEMPNINEVDRIRDIIFGGQQRDIERRFKDIERKAEALSGELRQLTESMEHDRSETDNRLNLLEERLRQEVQTIENRMQTNRKEILDRLAVVERQFSERLARLDQSLGDRYEALNDNKADRFDLGDLLMETGMRLRREKAALNHGQG